MVLFPLTVALLFTDYGIRIAWPILTTSRLEGTGQVGGIVENYALLLLAPTKAVSQEIGG